MTATKNDVRGALAPGSVVVIRDEEWLVRATEETADGTLVHVQGLSELVRDTSASFYTALDDVTALDPALAKVVADGSPRYRTARLWLESTVRKTAVPLGERSLTRGHSWARRHAELPRVGGAQGTGHREPAAADPPRRCGRPRQDDRDRHDPFGAGTPRPR